MAPQDALLKKFCSKPETYRAARSLLRTAQAKTGPGSGHEVGAHSTGLPAICAYLASQELCNNDISETVAQSVSCLKPKDFEKTLNLVRSVLVDFESLQQPSSQALTYESLARFYNIDSPSRVAAWATDVEQALMLGVKKGRYDNQVPLAKCAVFFWTCSLLSFGQVTQGSLMERYRIASRSFNALLGTLDKICGALGTRIESEWQQSSQHPEKLSPSKNDYSTSPTKSQSTFLALTNQKGSSKSPARKRKFLSTKTATDEEDQDMMLEPPTKKRKQASVVKDALRILPTKSLLSIPTRSMSLDTEEADNLSYSMTPTSAAFSSPRRYPTRQQSPDEVTVDGSDAEVELQSPNDPHADSEIHYPKRFRPVFLDHKQWIQRDPKLEREWEQAEAHKQSMMTLYGHPFEKYRPRHK